VDMVWGFSLRFKADPELDGFQLLNEAGRQFRTNPRSFFKLSALSYQPVGGPTPDPFS